MLTLVVSTACLVLGYVLGLCKGRKEMQSFYAKYFAKKSVITKA